MADAPGGCDPLLSVRDLRTTFRTDQETVHAVDGVDFDVYPGETVGIVGESGSGKTVTARSLLGLVEDPGVVHPESVVRYRGDAVHGPDAPDGGLADLRGRDVAMVFQDSLASLNPVYTVGEQIREGLRYQRGLSGERAREKAIALLEDVGIPDAPRRVTEYPHEFSGGMRQRALIAVALACDPDLLVCDEPTTALDVVTQAQLLELLLDLQAEHDLALLLVTHDMGVVAQTADRVNVMYAGDIVESAPVDALFDDPKHPYTRGLLESVPRTDATGRLESIDGDVPTPTGPASRCRFAPRCPDAADACERAPPASVSVGDDRTVSCFNYPDDLAEAAAVDYHRARRDERPAEAER